jgi:SET domain-containing protein
LVEKGRVFAPEIGLNAVNVSIYLNHSKKPNLRFDDKDVLRAVRDIERGDELTIDYDISFDDDHDFSDN